MLLRRGIALGETVGEAVGVGKSGRESIAADALVKRAVGGCGTATSTWSARCIEASSSQIAIRSSTVDLLIRTRSSPSTPSVSFALL